MLHLGILLTKSESPLLYEAVKRLILNPELRQRLSASAWERVQSLRWDAAVQTLSAAYETWLAEHRAAARERILPS